MKIGILGLPQTGKKTIFAILTGSQIQEHIHADFSKSLAGTAQIGDPRLDSLSLMYPQKKKIRPKIDITLLPKIEGESIKQGEIFKDIVDMDAICHIVRAFTNDSVYHVSGSIDPKRDIDMINDELILHDLIFIEKRMERIENNLKKMRDKSLEAEKDLLLKLKGHLDSQLPLRLLSLTDQQKMIIASYPFITLKEMIVVLNVSETDINDDHMVKSLKKLYEPMKIDILQVSAKVEAEIAALESDEEKKEFLKALGIEEPALNLLSRQCIKILGLLSFFTIGKDEVRQWLVKAGSTAPEAAGTIHTDMQRGFIRCEVMKYADLQSLKNEANVRHAGKYYVKGRDYIIEDGDIINIRFNV